MTYSAKDLYKIMDAIDHHTRAVQTQLVELRAAMATIRLPQDRSGFSCAECGIIRPTQQMLLDHLSNVHGLEPKEAA